MAANRSMMRNLGKNLIILSMIVFFCSLSFSYGASQYFPNRPIRLIVPYTAGSGNDIHSRGIAPYVKKHIGVMVLIDNRPGADARIGTNDAWKAAPDGYTIFNPGMPTPIINEKLFPVNYKTVEFTHIFGWCIENFVLVVNSETWKTPKEFFTAAQAKTLACGLTGIGSVSQFIGLALADAVKFAPVNWVPFTGGAETMVQLAGKHIDFGITTVSSARSLVDAGKLRPLLIFSYEKDYMFPNVPTLKDVGISITPMPVVRGVMAPPGVPAKVRTVLEQAFEKAVREPDFLDWAQKVRVEIAPIGHEKFLSYTRSIDAVVEKYIDKIKIKK